MSLTYSVIKTNLRWLAKLIVGDSDFSNIILRCLISFMEMVSSSHFWSTSLRSDVSLSFGVLDSIFSRDTPASFCLRWRQQRCLVCSLALSFFKRVLSLLSYWGFPCWAAFLALSSRYVSLTLTLLFFSLYYLFLFFYFGGWVLIFHGKDTSVFLWFWTVCRLSSFLSWYSPPFS